MCELDANPGAAHIVKRINTFGANGLISRDRLGSTDELYTYDPQGNLAQITDASGAVTVSLQTDGFGLTRASDNSMSTLGSGSLRAYGFGGQWGYAGDGEDGLILCTHRFYDPSNGRWLTRDPINYFGGINVYSYSGNNPINEIDPNGLLFGNHGHWCGFANHGQHGAPIDCVDRMCEKHDHCGEDNPWLLFVPYHRHYCDIQLCLGAEDCLRTGGATVLPIHVTVKWKPKD